MIKFRANFPEDFVDPRYCSVDPISAGVGAMIGGITSLFGGGSKPAAAAAPTLEAPPPAAPPATAAPQRQNTGSMTPSFIGSSAIPAAAGSNQKSLLGQ